MKFICFICALFLAFPAFANNLEKADESAARIMVYFAVGRDDTPAASVTIDQFKAHMAELANGNYTVLSLADILKAYKGNKPLPENTVAITFDGGDKSVLVNAAPILADYDFPYTVFISTGYADTNYPNHLSWADIKTLSRNGLASFGLHPDSYMSLSGKNEETIRSRLNNATVRFRNEMDVNPLFFAYPFGKYNQNYHRIVSAYGYLAAFGQQSGVAYNGADLFALPRFTMTENYANIDRFRMTANALPLPVTDMTPRYSHINNAKPSIGFSAPDLSGQMNRLSCFASGQDKPVIDIVGDSRVEIRLKDSIDETRFRLNCTLPTNDKNQRWRWLGALYTSNETIVESQEQAAQ